MSSLVKTEVIVGENTAELLLETNDVLFDPAVKVRNVTGGGCGDASCPVQLSWKEGKTPPVLCRHRYGSASPVSGSTALYLCVDSWGQAPWWLLFTSA